jgi:hypothetical protein
MIIGSGKIVADQSGVILVTRPNEVPQRTGQRRQARDMAATSARSG